MPNNQTGIDGVLCEFCDKYLCRKKQDGVTQICKRLTQAKRKLGELVVGAVDSCVEYGCCLTNGIDIIKDCDKHIHKQQLINNLTKLGLLPAPTGGEKKGGE